MAAILSDLNLLKSCEQIQQIDKCNDISSFIYITGKNMDYLVCTMEIMFIEIKRNLILNFSINLIYTNEADFR